MYLGIDIGGTKTLVACLNNKGIVIESVKFPTSQVYTEFLKELAVTVANLATSKFLGTCVAVPGRIDRQKGTVIALGNLPWSQRPIQHDIQKIVKCPVIIENDANLAGLSEAMLITQYACVLYITISTGIGTGIITNQEIDPEFWDSEGGHILLEHNGTLQQWEDFAAGSAIVKRFGKLAGEITDSKSWDIIVDNIAIGLYDLITFTQPDAVVLGGGVSTHFEKFGPKLVERLKSLSTPLTPIPPILKAQRPNEAVIHGCFYLAKKYYGSARA